VVIKRVGEGVLWMPIEDTWVTIEAALNAFEPDFKIERPQPEHQRIYACAKTQTRQLV
jgi:antitoxin VapB